MLARKHEQGSIRMDLNGFYLVGIDKIFFPVKTGYLYHVSIKNKERSDESLLPPYFNSLSLQG
jgi:hypothetical protein